MKRNDHLKFGFLLSYVDMLYAVLTSILVLFILTVLLINVHKNEKPTGKVDTDAQVQIVMTWKPDGVANDIDLWVQPPTGEFPVGYSHPQNTYMNLNRDDLGKANDFAIVNGQRELILGHREVIDIRKKVPGHYVVNAEFYAIHNDGDAQDATDPTEVTVQLIQVNPEFKVLTSQTFILKHQDDEHTAFQFDIEQDGTIDNIVTAEEVPFVHKFVPTSN